MKTAIVAVLAVALGFLGMAPARASGSIPAPAGLTSTDVSFTGFGGLTLHGTVLAPVKTGKPRPGIVLVTGSGAGVPREHLLTEATEFARRGLAVLIYDKRSEGYTNFRRSYSELADDALGGVRALRARPGVDPAKVGVWGLSEGGWVAPHRLRTVSRVHSRGTTRRNEHAIVTGKPDASKGARPVWAGGHWKRTRKSGHLASGLPVLQATPCQPVTLRLALVRDGLHVEVWDSSPEGPRAFDTGPVDADRAGPG